MANRFMQVERCARGGAYGPMISHDAVASTTFAHIQRDPPCAFSSSPEPA